MASINTGTTLDIRPTPGQDIRFATTSADSVFTFGNFRIDRDRQIGFLENTGSSLSYTSYYTLENLDSTDFDILKIINTKTNELNPNMEEPTSHAYFGSFYTKVANAINNIIDNFPYAFLSSPISNEITIYDYSADLVQNKTNFKIAFSSITNQGNVIYVSGRTEQSEAQIDLYNETSKFEIQLSGNSQNNTTATTFYNTIHEINSYNYSASTYLEFEIKGILLPLENPSATTFNYPIYIRPSRKRYGEYKKTISNIEKHLLDDGTFLVPDSDTDTYDRVQFSWPKTIDGFAPNSYGVEFENYATSLLSAARTVDEEKTNIMLRTMLPENFLDLDSQNQVYRKLTTVYSEEFDKIKQYIDGIAYAHSITYDGSESLPNKFLVRLANLLGAKLPNAFTSENIIDYLAGEFDETDTSFEEYNLDLWRRIMVNIVWLYKKRGTRDAISFIFKLIGAPDCLFNLEEFVYDVKQVYNDAQGNIDILNLGISSNIFDELGILGEDAVLGFNQGDSILPNFGINGNNSLTVLDGYPNVNNEIFQTGGIGRGSGQQFIDSLGEQYEPERRVDNLKIEKDNKRDIVNSKEINVDLRPSRAIECDVMSWYELGNGWWNWGSTASYSFSGLSVPFEWQIEEQTLAYPDNVSGMTIYEWLNYIYTVNVDPRDRKTKGWEQGHTGTYRDLKKLYITYMLWSNSQDSNRLTFKKLEKFLNLLERNFQELVPFFIPSTSILNTYGTVYGNTEFNRHRFIYRPGINAGSEFKVEIPPVFETSIQMANFGVNISGNHDANINVANFSVNVPSNPNANLDISNFSATLSTSVNTGTNGASANSTIHLESTNIEIYAPFTNLTPIAYPE